MTDDRKLSDTFKPFRLPSEPWDFGTTDNVEQLILLMRKVVDHGSTIFYRYTPEGEYSPSDLCMGETTLFVYRKDTEHSKGFLRSIGSVITDAATDIVLEAAKMDEWGMHYVSPGRDSNGCITDVYSDSPMGTLYNTSAWESCKLLLRTAAATNSRQHLSFPQVTASSPSPYDQSYIVRAWDGSRRTHQDLAKVTVSSWSNHYCDHFAIELL